MERVSRLTATEAEQILKRYGFELVSQKGSPSKVASSRDGADCCCAHA
jgi:predicted RNA binding protein YcfA (HicA-like mRNA interferase family)